jgi:hypothetical protein
MISSAQQIPSPCTGLLHGDLPNPTRGFGMVASSDPCVTRRLRSTGSVTPDRAAERDWRT